MVKWCETDLRHNETTCSYSHYVRALYISILRHDGCFMYGCSFHLLLLLLKAFRRTKTKQSAPQSNGNGLNILIRIINIELNNRLVPVPEAIHIRQSYR